MDGGKKYVSVDANFDTSGSIWPLCVVWEDGSRYPVERVIDVRPCASLKAGGAGIRYQCRIGNQTRYLWLEETKWFVTKEAR